MTDSTPPPMPDFPPPVAPVAKGRRSNAIVIGAAVAVIATIITTGIVVVQSTDDEGEPAPATTSSAPSEDIVADDVSEPDPEPTYAEVGTDSFTIELRTTERHCFGSAGCNVTVEPDLTYLGDTEGIDPDAVYEITYEVRGDESGPVIETAELTDRTSLNFTPTSISTSSASTEVSVEITDVVVQGG
ncbi:hypothetical protein [Streptomyces geranii]|uniref:hypothetical protein n=1 Tax=Streptomyces geranii TaxID=2058923 RepID=UPI000D03F4A1|nr:hypothetical protein [Streptomyces geranii]